MNRRLFVFRDQENERRYKTADTRISISRKLPLDFFNSKKSINTPPEQLRKRQKASLPLLRKTIEKNNSEQLSSKVLT